MQLSNKAAHGIRTIVPGVLAAALVGHFGMTLAYLTPLSPMRLASADLVNSYMEPIFSQRWDLFAPGEASKSRILLFGCRLQGDTRADDEIPWLDATTGLRHEHYENRLGYADRVLRAQKAGATFLAPPLDALTSAVTKTMADDPAAAKALEEERTSTTETGRDIYARIASVECDREYGRGRTTDVRVRIVTETLPTYSKRNDRSVLPAREAADLPWSAYQSVDSY